MFYRLRQSIAYRYFQFKTQGLEHTPPLKSKAQATCEVHTMLSRNDVRMYLLAIKSLLSFVPDLAVVVHSDGSLLDADIQHIAAHVPGTRFVRRDEADQRAKEQLKDSPFLAKWRETDAAYRRLIDIELWRQTEKVIVLDSDVLTIDSAPEVAEWIRNGSRPFLLGQPARRDGSDAESPSEHVQASFFRKVDEISDKLNLPSAFVQGATAGFCGYFNELAPPKVEAALQAALSLGLPMGQWGGDQCLVIFLLSVAGGQRLPADRYLNFDPSVRQIAERASIIHFYGTHRFHGLVYPNLATKTVQRLTAG